MLLAFPDAQIYSCGPGPLLDALESASAHWPAGSLHIERFAAKDLPASAGALDSFEVVCQRSGVTLKIRPSQSSSWTACDTSGHITASTTMSALRRP